MFFIKQIYEIILYIHYEIYKRIRSSDIIMYFQPDDIEDGVRQQAGIKISITK
jgi:hypothetical protein